MSFVNVGSTDRLIRLIIGLALIAMPFILGISLTSLYGIAMLAVGAILAITAVVKFCPLYRIIGTSTIPKA